MSVALAADGAQKRWIESPRYDLALLALSPLCGLLVAAAALYFGEQRLLKANFIETMFFLLGMPHYLSTYSFFMGDENVSYYRTRKLAFFVGPLLIVGLLTASLALHFYILVTLVVDTWNVFHVSRQSMGILSIYRHRGRGNNMAEKLAANSALFCLCAGLYCIRIDKQDSFGHYLGMLPWNPGPYLTPVLLTIGLIALGVLLGRMRRRGSGIGAPELVFLLSSCLLFAPYIFIRYRPLASTAMLSGHYIQYLGILWLLNHRRYAGGMAGSIRQTVLARMSANPMRVITLLAIVSLGVFGIDRIVHVMHASAFHTWWLNIVVLLHFYFDGLFWAFKHPYVRGSIGPYLVWYEPKQLAAA
jgi:hypothetical protein